MILIVGKSEKVKTSEVTWQNHLDNSTNTKMLCYIIGNICFNASKMAKQSSLYSWKVPSNINREKLAIDSVQLT